MDKLQWEISVPIFRNIVISKQLGLAIGIPFSLVAIVIVLASGRSIYTLYGLGFIGVLLVLTFLFVLVVYRGKYEVELYLITKAYFVVHR